MPPRYLGAVGREIRLPEDLPGIDALIIPGGESTTIGKLATRFGLIEPLRELIDQGLPTYGTCAGLIFVSSTVTEGSQPLLGVLDVAVQRNAFGRQNESFETDLEIEGFDTPFHAVFIRAPWVEKVGGEVEVLASVRNGPTSNTARAVRTPRAASCSPSWRRASRLQPVRAAATRP